MSANAVPVEIIPPWYLAHTGYPFPGIRLGADNPILVYRPGGDDAALVFDLEGVAYFQYSA